MKIAVASGKGGTGKTTVATNLARVASLEGRSVAYLDCDVEEPNGALFLKPEIEENRAVGLSVPEVDLEKCTACGACEKICQYSAIVLMNKKVMVFPELCHGCAGCWLVCPVGAITEGFRETGRLHQGHSGPIAFVEGLLDVGQAMSPPVIRQVRDAVDEVDLTVLDSPPGTSCPVIESVRDTDFVMLVTEPTPFGLNDLKLAVEMVRALGIDFGVVVNRAGLGDNKTTEYCQTQRIEILAEIPDDRRVAEAYSRGEMAVEALPEFRQNFGALLKRLDQRVQKRQDEISQRRPVR